MMQKNIDGIEFVQLLTGTSEIYSKSITDFGIDMWFEDLKDYPIERVKMAFKAHRKDPKNGQFMPKPADIVRHIDGLPTEIATQAWLKVIEAVKRVGAWGSVQFDDLSIHSAIDTMGGWTKLCAMTDDELPFKQREFEKLYAEKVKFNHGYVPKHLAGFAEIQNHSSGLAVEAPVLIGFRDNVKPVLTNRKAISHAVE